MTLPRAKILDFHTLLIWYKHNSLVVIRPMPWSVSRLNLVDVPGTFFFIFSNHRHHPNRKWLNIALLATTVDNVIRVYLPSANTAIRQEILCIGSNNHNQILFEVEDFCQKRCNIFQSYFNKCRWWKNEENLAGVAIVWRRRTTHEPQNIKQGTKSKVLKCTMPLIWISKQDYEAP